MSDGVAVMREPERALMSRRPGIGRGWIDKYRDDVYKDDTVIINTKAVKPPRYYDSVLSDLDAQLIKRARKKSLIKLNATRERLRVREQVKSAQISSLKRKLK